ncbi:MAG: CBS domain-containing protein [Haliscomenobacter sp.]|nr:CBS domain-containing protein [Haliscomenobacter sp.]MBK8655840.1 CBS domain-containing protein [Haliscomenobacter sp.]MBP9076170.1 CBS domain-containing protein [Haliscomenobacter sp.]MBP9873516.1 CBS domain-containing protein [Haliscomenobacter sp.]
MTTSIQHKIADIMSRQVLVAHPDHEFLPLCRLFLLMNIHHLPVVQKDNGEILGILSANDVLRAFSFKLPELGRLDEATLNKHFSVLDLMTPHPLQTISPEDPISLAARIFSERNISSLPVVEEGKLVGIVTNRDIVKFYSRNATGQA